MLVVGAVAVEVSHFGRTAVTLLCTVLGSEVPVELVHAQSEVARATVHAQVHDPALL